MRMAKAEMSNGGAGIILDGVLPMCVPITGHSLEVNGCTSSQEIVLRKAAVFMRVHFG